MSQCPIVEVVAPELLTTLQGWLVWQYESAGNRGKPLKVPYYVNGNRRKGTNGSEEDRTQLTDFASARQYASDNDYTGVGLALMPEFGVTALDFDNCIDELTGDIHPDVLNVIKNTYAEYSPSGNGVRAFVIGSLGNRKNHGKDGSFGFELFDSKGFVTFTGNAINDNEIGYGSLELTRLIDERFPKVERKAPASPTHDAIEVPRLAHALRSLDASCSYSEWLNIGMAIHYETSGSAEGFLLWDSWSANSPDKYVSTEHNQSKWDSFGRGGSGPQITGRSLLKMSNPQPKEVLNFTSLDDSDGTTTNFYNIRTAAEFSQQITPVTWLIKGVLPKATLGMLYGESGSGKSFVALDMCASLARGEPWNNIPIKHNKKHRILYVVAEGVGGFVNRLSAYCRQHDLDISTLSIDILSDAAPNLTDGVSVDHLIRDIETRGAYDLIIMDTFAQVTAGANENSGEDMGKALAYCRKISKISSAMVLLIHHSGKDASKGARGWSGNLGASDVMLEISRYEEYRKIRVAKQKDGSDGKEYGFSLTSVILGHDEDGDEITSCIVTYGDAMPTKGPNLKVNQQLIVDTFNTYEVTSWVTIDHVISLCVDERGVKDGEKLWDIKRNIKRTLQSGVGLFLECNSNGEIRLLEAFRAAQ